MKNFYKNHRILFVIISFFLVAFILYLIFSIYVSITLNGIIKKALSDEPYDNQLSYVISEDDYEYINPRQPEFEEDINVKTEWSNTFPIVFPFLSDVHFKYSYTVTDVDTDEIIYGSLDSDVTIKLDYTFPKIHIANVEKAP
jgi:hypothetical protein